MNVIYRNMTEADIAKVTPLYIDYYNSHDGDEWTAETVGKRIYQVLASPDSYCIIAENADNIIGFAMGRFEQFFDLVAYNLVEIIIAREYQSKGFGSQMMLELERRVKAEGASMVQLMAVNDDKHNRFYDRLNYKNATNLLLKSKFL